MQMTALYNYLDSLQANGLNSFITSDLASHLGLNQKTVQVYISRLKKKGIIASPLKTFHLIIPPEYRILGCLPPEQFIDHLMQYLKMDYYVGLLTSSDFYGASHHKPQIYQVLVSKARRPIRCGKVRIEFHQKANLDKFPIDIKNTRSGTIKLATPELTALDLVGYEKKVGGLNNVAIILKELLVKVDIKKLLNVAKLCPISWVQRLAYLAVELDSRNVENNLVKYIKTKNASYTPLFVGAEIKPKNERNLACKIIINEKLELKET